MARETTPVHSPEMVQRYFSKVLEKKDFGALPLCFDIRVLERYREAGLSMIRTRSAGRVQGQGWRIDFGIVDDAGIIHAAAEDLFQLPAAERAHWAAYVVAPPLNARFLKMRLGLGACVDEGDILTWDGRPQPELAR